VGVGPFSLITEKFHWLIQLHSSRPMQSYYYLQNRKYGFYQALNKTSIHAFIFMSLGAHARTHTHTHTRNVDVALLPKQYYTHTCISKYLSMNI